MNARANISYVDKTNNIHTIYCHNGGFIEELGTTLFNFYNNVERVTELISNGDASYIDKLIEPDPNYAHSWYSPQKDVCLFYHRDREEPWEGNKPNILNLTKTNLNKVMGMQDYNYIFMDNKWYVHRRGDVGIYELTEDVVENGLPWEEEE